MQVLSKEILQGFMAIIYKLCCYQWSWGGGGGEGGRGVGLGKLFPKIHLLFYSFIPKFSAYQPIILSNQPIILSNQPIILTLFSNSY